MSNEIWPHDDIMRRVALRTERRLAWQERKWRWQKRMTALLLVGIGAAVGMAMTGYWLYWN